MRVLVLVKASPESETGKIPPDFKDFVDEMNKFNEELTRAGVMLAADGLYASDKGKRVRFDGTKRSVIDGPFAETKELVAGFWIWQVRNMDEAVEWLKRAPFDQTEVEIRQVFETEDFAEVDPSGEVRKQEHRLRREAAENAKK